ncbi:MAG: DEAD/DEAH box helicase [Candidatus Xenobiia bacterium LiM19]
MVYEVFKYLPFFSSFYTQERLTLLAFTEACLCGRINSGNLRLLVPFRYYGISDPVDYKDIPWRNGRFDAESLEAAVDTEVRTRKTLECWCERAGRRTLAFCCTTRHADYMAGYFREQGNVRAVSVHSAEGSAQRAASLEQLRRGDIEVIFTVDIFNEGLDVPDLDTVLMIRPTESTVIFLQLPALSFMPINNYLSLRRGFFLNLFNLF